MGIFFECYLHDTVIVRKYGLVAIPEIQTPNLHVFVGRTCDN
jgi:hypothetical protein